ncbi:MAG: enoyl-CoA hydratase-related protein [Pseudomonadales bacterium]|nr:enoyl-CoA hydratase-related protein [Pseudomonadales bacterium]
MSYQTLNVEQQGLALCVTLNRPNARNAMSLQMVEELQQVFADLEQSTTIRALVLRGAEHNFCAGGDIKDMAGARAQANNTEGDNPYYQLNRAFGHMITRANHLPQVVICVLEGAVLGGGFGLACVSDVAITHENALFGLPETSLGVVPAQIAPFVVDRIGLTQARRLALLGERFNGVTAEKLGIAHYVCSSDEALETQLNRVLEQIKKCAPNANRTTKALLHRVGKEPMESLLDDAAMDFANAVASEEGAEGTMAFVQKRAPAWSDI